ncbi:MAG: cytochrome c biogenesis protein CcsA [Tepidisphaeraceae bacterium]|jgi:ABC-type uncharacterized transport system permease subunit
MPSPGQLALLSVAVAFLVAGGAVSLLHRDADTTTKWRILRWCSAGGIVSALGVVLWHSVAGRHWQPATDNFEALIWLGILLSAFVLYVQSIKPIVGLDWFLMPAVVGLLIAAGIVARLDYTTYHPIFYSTYLWVHRITSYSGTAAFVVAAASGAVYVLSAARLRKKKSFPMSGSLERLEHIMMTAVTLGFALLTIGLVTGLEVMLKRLGTPPWAKVYFASATWLLYAVVMHAPINPRFRGRRAALLSVMGIVLVVGTLVAAQFVPGGGR